MMATATMFFGAPEALLALYGMHNASKPTSLVWSGDWVLPIERSLPNGGRSGRRPMPKRCHARLDSTI